ncbi:MAG: hypothetical protein QOF59_2045 [Actinomycetota bacterium]|nr:hypothetical protein [Actinomycetota bacterium]MDQ1476893.1 hypothetical protein [Actinomycetota bacterium]
MTTTAERLRDTHLASPVLIAVMFEFANKADRATHSNVKHTAVIELEQVGDRANVAAEADIREADATRQVVLDAHLAICIAKAKL